MLKDMASGNYGVGTAAITMHSACTSASGTLTVTTCNAADTFAINGTTFTAQQAYATGTVTINTIAEDATVTIDGIEFTAKDTPSASSLTEFQSSDGTGGAGGAADDAAAASLVAKINAHPDLTTRVTATASAAAVVTIRAYSPGTDGNSIEIASSTESVSAATLENGAAVANNKFCFTGSATEIATDIVRAVGASTTTLLGDTISASNVAGVVTFTSKISGKLGNLIALTESTSGARMAVSGAVLASGAGTTHNISL